MDGAGVPVSVSSTWQVMGGRAGVVIVWGCGEERCLDTCDRRAAAEEGEDIRRPVRAEPVTDRGSSECSLWKRSCLVKQMGGVNFVGICAVKALSRHYVSRAIELDLGEIRAY